MNRRGADQPERRPSPSSDSSPASHEATSSQSSDAPRMPSTDPKRPLSTDPMVSADSGRSITRTDLETVIRRAAELSLADSDAQDRLSEQDLVRIADELGLPAKHVWQALYERPSLSAPAIIGEMRFGSPIIVASRIVPGDVALTRRRLEDYLVTQEYLTIARRTADELRLIPAEDTISSVARVFARPRRRHHLAHARRVIVGAHPLPSGEAAVRIEVDLSEQRLAQRRQGILVGGLAGLVMFGAGALAGDAVVAGAASEIASLATGTVAASASAWGIFAAYGRSFRRKVAEAKLELDALLDRLETGERLEPPPAPWRRRLGLRLFGSR